MASITAQNITEDVIGAQLDKRIESLQSQIKSLQTQRALQNSAIFSSRSSNAFLTSFQEQYQSATPLSHSSATEINPLHSAILSRSKDQRALNQSNLYRFCSTITTCKMKDPDPRAVDNGAVFGIRIEAFTSGKFIRPYYVHLNKPYPSSQLLRIHRHTVPPCIALEAVAKKYLPTPATSADIMKARKQNLPAFVRSLRRDIVGYHNRIAVIAGLRKSFGLDDKKGSEKGKGREPIFQDISAVDAEARQIRLEWVDGKIGRVVIGDKGELKRCCIVGPGGRDRRMERMIMGGNSMAEGIEDRLNVYV